MKRKSLRIMLSVILNIALAFVGARTASAIGEGGTDVNVSKTALEGDGVGPEAEMMIAVNPQNSDNMVIACHGEVQDNVGDGWGNDYPDHINVFWTDNGGDSWHRVPIGSNLDGINDRDSSQEDCRTDPTIVFDENGVLYVAYLVIPDYFQDDSNPYHVVVGRSTEGGIFYPDSFTTVESVPWPLLDKVHLAAGPDTDPSNDYQGNPQNVYLTWNSQGLEGPTGLGHGVWVVSREDAVGSWSPPVHVEARFSANFVDPAVGPNGELYIAYEDSYNDNGIMRYGFHMRVSTDEGNSFGDPNDPNDRITLTNTSDFPLEALIPAQFERGIDPIPVLDVDRTNGTTRGRVYLAYNDFYSELNNTDIFLIYSDTPRIRPRGWVPYRSTTMIVTA
jgi:hypothetical protein